MPRLAGGGSWRKGSPSHVIAATKALGGSPRKCRLHCVACCRLVAEHIDHPDCLALIDLVETFADDASLAPEVAKLRRKVSCWATAIHPSARSERDWCARWSAYAAADPKALAPVTGFVRTPEFRDALAEVYGPREGGVYFAPSWRTDTAVSLARQMYAAREFSAMPILADALQDAGCDSEVILAHCRDADGSHVRGCWVTDLVLGRQ